jgi:hypothetical protein
MMSPKFFELSPLSADCTIRAGLDGPEQLQKLLIVMGWSLLFSLSRDGRDEVQRWTSADGGSALDLNIPRVKVSVDPVPTHQGVGASWAAKQFLEVFGEVRTEAEECPEAYDFFLPNRSMLDVIAFYELDPEDRMAIVN